MKRYLAAWLRKTANRLDPPPQTNFYSTGAPYFTNSTSASSTHWTGLRR